jgi:hypothetical protein
MNYIKTIQFVVFIALVSILSACGGNGNNSTFRTVFGFDKPTSVTNLTVQQKTLYDQQTTILSFNYNENLFIPLLSTSFKEVTASEFQNDMTKHINDLSAWHPDYSATSKYFVKRDSTNNITMGPALVVFIVINPGSTQVNVYAFNIY